ncbi:hypothetical protein MATL_G00039520 [Megalops atlanticus]|uniref:Rho-GAP domain-containing protein n=1 Tax=Megalops atlanticus TaxID=7932 RepID=A0A9D3Q9Z9_MEGAT|nr:hypothetical protein MATL_G00039520 [Megalops atlanticus]
MHARNLALVWAPNLLRSKEIEVPTCNGDIAFLEVRVQQSVVEFILNHTEQIFNHRAGPSLPEEGKSLVCETKCASLPASSQCLPMKLMSLEEAQARSLDQNHPARKDHQWMNSLPDKSAAALDYKIIDLPDCKRKFSGKSRKWKSIFNLGRSVTDSKGKLSRNGSVFVRAQKLSEKAPIRPTKSMDSLCSLSTEDNDRESKFRRPSEGNGFFTPAFKSHTLGSGSIYDLTKEGHEFEPEILLGATGVSPSVSRTGKKSGTTPLQKALPEQLKVFKGDDLNNCQPTSPKNRRMLYSCNTSNGSSKPSFPGSLFPLESSPRHQHKALNISEPFAVSVPLRVSAVISSNSTPCRAPGKDKAVFPPLQPMRCSNDSSNSYVSMGKEDWNAGAESEREAVCTTTEAAEGHNTELRGCRGTVVTSEPQQQLLLNTKEKTNEPSGALHPSAQASMQPISSTTSRNTETREDLTSIQPSSLHAAEFTKPPRLENLLTQQFELEELIQPDKTEELWPFTHLELKIIEPDIDIRDTKKHLENMINKKRT